MQHIAIDPVFASLRGTNGLGLNKSQICVRSASGQILEETSVATHRIEGFLDKRNKSKVILETCSQAFSVATQARAMGHEVIIVPATLVRSLGVGDRGIKTDARDARNLSAASCRVELPSVHIPSARTRKLRAACAAREALVGTRRNLVNCVRGYLRSNRVILSRGTVQNFPQRVSEALQQQPDRSSRPTASHRWRRPSRSRRGHLQPLFALWTDDPAPKHLRPLYGIPAG